MRYWLPLPSVPCGNRGWTEAFWRIDVVLNGMLVNQATGCDVRPGKIGLQSEGGVIHFRTVALTPQGRV